MGTLASGSQGYGGTKKQSQAGRSSIEKRIGLQRGERPRFSQGVCVCTLAQFPPGVGHRAGASVTPKKKA